MLVDGSRIRDTLDTDFNIMHRHGMELRAFAPKFYIPRGEVWVDFPYADEIDYLLTAENVTDKINAENRAALLAELKRIGFLPPGPPPPFILRREYRHPLTICTVNGAIVRKHIDPDFVLGGHDLVYSYIPKNEVWIDGKMILREQPIVLAHEVEERTRMERDKLIYEISHEFATVMERVLRRKYGGAFPGEWNYPFDELTSPEITQQFYVAQWPRAKRPVTVEHIRQSESMCGPASLRIACSAFGKEFTEEELAKLSDATLANGTEHEGLVKAAKIIGAKVIEKEGGTLEEVEVLVKKGIPVIVGWFAEDGDHYSVVVDITPKHVILSDPEWHMPERFVERTHFEKVWFDFVGTDNKVASWKWYMAIKFEE